MSNFGDACKALWAKASPALLEGIDRHADEILEKYGINTRLRITHFGAQLSHESSGGSHLTESLKYSAKRLTQVWPKRFPTLEAATPYALNEPALAEKVYGGRLGNDRPGDGFKYRGGGLLQETGKNNYADLQEGTGLPVLEHPELVKDPEHALECAAYRFVKLGCLPYCDRNDVAGVTRHVNGGLTGLDERKAWLADWEETLED